MINRFISSLLLILSLSTLGISQSAKLTELPVITPVSTDIVYCVHDPSGTPVSNACTVGSISSLAPQILSSSSAGAFIVGPNGATNPTFTLTTNTASGVTGVKITNAAAGGGVGVTVTSSASNENFNLSGKGTGYVAIPTLNIGGGTFDATYSMTLRDVDNGDFTGLKVLSNNEIVALSLGRSGIQATNGMLFDTPAAAFSGYLGLTEVSAPSAPGANGVRIYAEDNGSGKTRIMALFATGAAQQIAIQP